MAGFLSEYTPYDRANKTSLKKYKVTDDYLRFYFKFIQPMEKKILSAHKIQTEFPAELRQSLNVWLGFAFENYCQKNALYLAEKMGFSNQVINFGPYFVRNDEGFQVDLVYLRSDKIITICEIKHHQNPITTKIIAEVERKVQKIKAPKGFTVEKALITYCGAEPSLIDTQYFNYIISVEDLLN